MKLFLYLASACTIATSAFSVDLSNLKACVEEVKQNNALADSQQPLFVNNYQGLLMALQSQNVRGSFPAVYQTTVLDPFIAYLQSMGPSAFYNIFVAMQQSPMNDFLRSIIPDVTEAILQNGTGFEEKATNAFQEMVSDLYDGFLSDSNRVSKETGRPIKPPDLGVTPPIVKWGNPKAGPYTWPADAVKSLQLKAGIVSLPPSNLKGGLLAWSTLPHETAGHDILHADNGLLNELGNLVYNAIVRQLSNNTFLASYWKQCIDETASDVVGTLHGGPTIGIGLIGYFRGLFGGTLRNIGYLPPADAHPIDLLRGYLAARVISQMGFSAAAEWSAAIRAEVDKDLQQMYLVDGQTGQMYALIKENAIRSAEIVADTIVNSKLSSLEGHSLKEIQNWSDEDQMRAETLGMFLKNGSSLPVDFRNSSYYAAHVVAGATIEALKANANISFLFTRMIEFLDTMHQYNSTWAGNVPPPLPPAPPSPPLPPSWPTGDCACLFQCFEICKGTTNKVAYKPRPCTQPMEEAVGE